MPTTSAPLGTYPLGYGAPVEGPQPPTVKSTFSRYINPGTKSFQVDPATGHLAQMPGTRQRVLLALSAALNSSTVLRGFGLRGGGRIGSDYVNRTQGEVRFALRHLASAIRIEAIDVEKRSGRRLFITLAFTDLATGESGQKVTRST